MRVESSGTPVSGRNSSAMASSRQLWRRYTRRRVRRHSAMVENSGSVRLKREARMHSIRQNVRYRMNDSSKNASSRIAPMVKGLVIMRGSVAGVR